MRRTLLTTLFAFAWPVSSLLAWCPEIEAVLADNDETRIEYMRVPQMARDLHLMVTRKSTNLVSKVLESRMLTRGFKVLLINHEPDQNGSLFYRVAETKDPALLNTLVNLGGDPHRVNSKTGTSAFALMTEHGLVPKKRMGISAPQQPETVAIGVD